MDEALVWQARAGWADDPARAGVTICVAAGLYDPAFQLCGEERYRLFISEEEFSASPAQQLMDAGAAPRIHKIGALCAYNMRRIGVVIES